jgi:hypothetical protein
MKTFLYFASTMEELCMRKKDAQNGHKLDRARIGGVWLQAEKLNKQGMGRGFERQLTGIHQMQNTGVQPMGSGNMTGKEIRSFGGNHTPYHHSHKESIHIGHFGVMAPIKIVGGEIMEGTEKHDRNFGEGFLEAQNGKEVLGVNLGKMVTDRNVEQLEAHKKEGVPEIIRELNG